MPLHPVIQAALASAEGVPPYHTLPVGQARAQAKKGYPPKQTPVPVDAVRDFAIPGPAGAIPVRVYTPPGTGPHPILVFFHGSGFVLLDLDTHDDICRRLCSGASCVVVSVDYRLAPENKFPAGPDDCLAATRWVAAYAQEFDGDPARMALAGDSAGGCLAAVTALRSRDEGGPSLRGQLLFYPVTDYPSAPTGSYLAFGAGFGLTHAGMQWFWDQYLGDPSHASHPHASPLRTASPAGLPSICVLTAEYDVLRDEGHAYAHRLNEAGVAAVTHCYAGMNHGFLKYAGVIDEAGAAIDDACKWLKKIF
ncbi:MAG: alpha/beta hydrolase [Pseudomonadota bacterium]